MPVEVISERTERAVVRLVARLLGEDRSRQRVAAQLGGIVTLERGEVAHQVRREDMFPRERFHMIAGLAALILPRLLLIGQVRDIETLAIERDIEAKQVFRGRGVVEFEEALDGSALIVEILERWRIEEAIGGRSGRADEIAEFPRVAADIKRSLEIREAAARERHTARRGKLQPGA